MGAIAYMGEIYGSANNSGHTILSKLGTPMTARANLSFGNANVTDDETNDATKVDIQNIEPITQEAYNQLTQAEKNAHPWFITNATSFGGVYLFQTVALMEAAVQAGTVPAGAVMMTGVDTPYVPEAEDVVYDNTESELEATNAQNAIDEIVAELLIKQNATDNSLSTSSKNVVGAINELYSGKQDKLTNPLTKADVVNNLTSDATNVPLSAAMGKSLNDLIKKSSAVVLINSSIAVISGSTSWQTYSQDISRSYKEYVVKCSSHGALVQSNVFSMETMKLFDNNNPFYTMSYWDSVNLGVVALIMYPTYINVRVTAKVYTLAFDFTVYGVD